MYIIPYYTLYIVVLITLFDAKFQPTKRKKKSYGGCLPRDHLFRIYHVSIDLYMNTGETLKKSVQTVMINLLYII